MPPTTAGLPTSLILGLALGSLVGFLLGALLTAQLGTRLAAGVRGAWGRRYYGQRVRFDLLEQ